VAYLAVDLQELIRIQKQRPPTTMHLDTCFQLPNFVGQMNGKTMDSWLHSLSTYFKTSPEMEDATKFQIANLQLKGIAQNWWDTQLDSAELIVDLGTLDSLTIFHITSWDMFWKALRERFYPQGYLHNFLAKWLQLRQITNQSVQGYIDIFCKLLIQLHIKEPDELLIIKFNYVLLLPLRREVYLFDNTSLDKAFLWALAI
jgi:hypothetical protein